VVEANLTVTLTGPLSPTVLAATIDQISTDLTAADDDDDGADPSLQAASIVVVKFWQTISGSVSLPVEVGTTALSAEASAQIKESLALTLDVDPHYVFMIDEPAAAAASGRRAMQSTTYEELTVYFNVSAVGTADLGNVMQRPAFRNELVDTINNLTLARANAAAGSGLDPPIRALASSQVTVVTMSTLSFLEITVENEAESRSVDDVGMAFAQIEEGFEPSVLLATINNVDADVARVRERQLPSVGLT